MRELVTLPNLMTSGNLTSGFLGLVAVPKDIRIALDLAGSTGAVSRHAASTVALWAEAAQALPPDADHTEIVRWLRGEDR